MKIRAVVLRFLFVFGLCCMPGSMPASAQEHGQIRGQIRGLDGIGVGGVDVQLKSGSAAVETTLTDNEGRFSFTNIAAGKYSLTFQLGAGSVTEPDVDVRAGETATIEKSVMWDVGTVETLTVTAASRQRERLIDAPASISSVSDTEVRIYAATGEIPNALAGLPGVVSGQATLFDFNLNTRGMNMMLNRRIQTQIDGRNPSILFLSSQDWAPLSVMTDDLAPVEMLRGPGGAFYGANSFNGVVDMRTKSPRDSLGGSVRFSFGDPRQVKGEGRVAFALGHDYFLKLVAGYNRAESFAESRNVTREYAGLPGEAIPLPTRTGEVGTGLTRLDKYLRGGTLLSFEGGVSEMGGLLLVTGTGRTFADGRRTWTRFHLENDRWDGSVYTNTRRSKNAIAMSSGAPSFENERSGAAELRYRTSLLGTRFTGGVVYGLDGVTTADEQGRQTLLGRSVTAHRGAAFGLLERRVTEALTLQFSARVDANTLHDPQFSPRVAAVYAIRPGHLLRASYNEGFQVASHVEFFLFRPIGAPLNLSGAERQFGPLLGSTSLGLGRVPLIAQGNPNLLVEHIRTMEFGYKALLPGRGFFAANYYRNWMQNFISDAFAGGNPDIPKYQAPSTLPPEMRGIVERALNGAVAGLSNLPGGAPYIALSFTNTGRVSSEGVEAELSSRLVKRLQGTASYSWFNFRIQDQKPGAPVHPNAPRHTFSTSVGYRSLRFNADVRYRWVDQLYWANALFTGPVPAYGLVDLVGAWNAGKHYRLGMQVNNLADNVHYEVFGGDLLRRRVLGYVAYHW